MLSDTFLFACLIVIASLLLFSCAGQVAPSGGAVDSIPPTVVRTEPDTNAVRVQAGNIVLEFSEYVDRRSVEESIFISPFVGELDFDWSGREVTITFSGKLNVNTTYVVNVGTDVKDIRASNRMANGYTLAFSTGDTIDQGKISGRVFDEKPEGVMVFAYALDCMKPDTLDPCHTKPDYITQTGKEGVFSFSNLRFASYRIIAVRDEFRNLLYDRQTDQFGVTTGDVRINGKQPFAADLWFRLSGEDTTKPFLTKAIPLSRSHVLLRFSEALDTASFSRSVISLTDTSGSNPVAILLPSLERGDSLSASVLTAAPLDSGKTYKVRIENVVDRAGNLIDSANASVMFSANGAPDTLRPAFEIAGIRDSTGGVPLASTFEIRFTEPVKHNPLSTAISVLDSTNNRVPCESRWITASGLLISPGEPLISKAWYTIRIVMDSLRDYAGNGWKDSVNRTRFQSLDLKTTGTIEGTVMDADSGDHPGETYLTATGILSSTPAAKTLRMKERGKFRFEQLPEGRYTLSAFRDSDSSGTFSFGRPAPYVPSERFTVPRDTIKVRARWGVEGVVVKFNAAGR